MNMSISSGTKKAITDILINTVREKLTINLKQCTCLSITGFLEKIGMQCFPLYNR